MSHSGIVSKNHAFAVLCGSVLILSRYSETLLLPKDIWDAAHDTSLDILLLYPGKNPS